MSRAYICDSCGLILPVEKDAVMHPLWFRDSFAREVIGDNEANIHLCDSCWERFEQEYMKNLRMES